MVALSNPAAPSHRPQARSVEGRSLLTAGTNTFAIMPGTISTAGQTVTIPFTINSQNFTRPAGRLVLGVDVAADPSSSLKPEISSVIITNAPTTMPSAAHPRVTHAAYAPGIARSNTSLGTVTSAVLVHFQPPRGTTASGQTDNPIINTTNPVIDGEVVVKGLNNTTGAFLVGFYLPGDVAGTGRWSLKPTFKRSARRRERRRANRNTLSTPTPTATESLQASTTKQPSKTRA